MWPKGVDNKHYYPPVIVPAHEVYLSFSTDDDAIAFTDWLQEIGWGKFQNWQVLR